MPLAQELHLDSSWDERFDISHVNRVANVHERLDEIAEFIESRDLHTISLREPPVSEEVGLRVSRAIVSNTHAQSFRFHGNLPNGVAMRDLLPWIAGRGTLVHMTSLRSITFDVRKSVPVHEWDLLFPLLLSSASLQELTIDYFKGEDAVMSALARYLASSSLAKFTLSLSYTCNLSQTGFTSLCSGIAQSSLLRTSLHRCIPREANLETLAECLSQAIAVSSLRSVNLCGPRQGYQGPRQLAVALSRTVHVRNLDFTFPLGRRCLTIDRRWKRILAANVSLGLWPHILARAQVMPETCHGPNGILFSLLKNKPDLIPKTCLRKRKRND